jgi:ribosomal protein L18
VQNYTQDESCTIPGRRRRRRRIEALKGKIFNFNENNENHRVYPSACDINKTNNHLSSQIIEHKKDHDI